MKFTLEIKKMLKKTYKSIKKGLNSFLGILGFNKKESYDLSQKISEKIHKEISEYYKNKDVDEKIKKSFNSVMLELKMENEMQNQKMQALNPKVMSNNNNNLKDKYEPIYETVYEPIADLDKKNGAKKYRKEELIKLKNQLNAIEQEQEQEINKNIYENIR